MNITLLPFLMLILALASSVVAAEATSLRGGSLGNENGTRPTQRSLFNLVGGVRSGCKYSIVILVE